MKKCRTCNRTYADNTLSFCLEDGALLSAEYADPDATVVLPHSDASSQETEPNYRPEQSVATVISSVAKTGAPEPFQSTSEKKSITPHILYAFAGLLAVIIVVSSFIYFSQSSTPNQNVPSKPANQEQGITTASPAPSITGGQMIVVRECDTPCRMDVGLNQFIETGEKPVMVKFNRRNEWFTLSGRRDDPIPADKFNSGEAQFASPKGAPSVRVQIKQLR